MSAGKIEIRFLEVIESHKGILYKIANVYSKEEECRKDLIQEIVYQLWRSFPNYNDQYKLSTWIYRIALNVSINFYKKEQKRSIISNRIEESVFILSEDTNKSEPNPDLNLLQKCISELNEINKALIILHLEGNNHSEIAEILGITTTNVSTKINRIKKVLKIKLQALKARNYE